MNMSANPAPLEAPARRSAGLKPACRRRTSAAGFTLIEMLVVIAVIGILAALTVGVLPGVKEKQVRSRVKAELNMLVLAIEDYKKDQGFFPPCNGAPRYYGTNALYYELVGCVLNTATSTYEPKTGVTPVTSAAAQLNGVIGVGGFVNVSTGNKESRNYLGDLKEKQHGTTDTNPKVELLLAPYRSPSDNDFNPWHYNSSDPVHNPDSFDLWADLKIGDKTITIGNWRQ